MIFVEKNEAGNEKGKERKFLGDWRDALFAEMEIE